MCEELIYFCAKNKKVVKDEDGPTIQEEEVEDVAATTEETDKAKRLNEDVTKGKIEIAPSKSEREQNNTLGALK